MKIPLKQFEQYIDEAILKRGLQYFKKGLVHSLEELTQGQYEAIVEGSETYKVNFTINNGEVTEHVCSCPYDIGPVCKHMVAVLFYMQQDEIEMNIKPAGKKGAGKKTTKKKTVSEQIDGLLSKLSHEELKDYISEQCLKDSSFRRLFLAKYAYLVIPDSKALYTKQIRAILQTAAGRHGYIEYSDSGFVGYEVSEILRNAERQLENANYQTAVNMAYAIIEEMTKALDFADDSNGDIGGCISPAVEILETISGKPLKDELRNELFNYCINAFGKNLFKGWDWHFSMISIATQLVRTSNDAKIIYTLLDTIKPTGEDWDWDYDSAQRARLDLINKMEGESEAIRYMEKNITNSDFRKKLIEKAITKNDFTRALTFCEEGIKRDDKDKPGLADDWRDYLLTIYTAQKDTANILKYAHNLFLHANREKEPYYKLLKKHVSPSDWTNYVNKLVHEITNNNHWSDYSLIARIYIWEERWQDLLLIVKQNLSLSNIEQYEKYLVKDYANDITDMYKESILKYMESNVNRNHYQNACRYLRRMIKMGARAKADEVIEKLKKLYPNRRALMEELQRV